MKKLLDKKHFVCSDIERNSNKFWTIELYDDSTVVTSYGRVLEGAKPQVDNKTFGSIIEAQKYFNSKVKDKQRVKSRRDAYTEISLVSETSTTTGSVTRRDVESVALSEIETDSEESRSFVKWLCKVNVHDITTQTSIKYNIADGSFQTPLGIVDKTCLEKASDLLDKIAVYVKLGNITDKSLVQLVNTYLRYIPQDLGGSNTKINLKDIFGTTELLDKQSNLITALTASLSSAQISDQKDANKVFDTKISLVGDKSVIKDMVGYHSSKIGNIYSVSISPVKNAFNTHGCKYGNIQKRWHGTNPANALSILRNGLIIPKNYTNGRVYGDGVYLAVKATSSLGYAVVKDKKQLLFVAQTALGKPKTHGSVTIRDDSLFLGDYTVIPRTCQIDLLYIVEFI